MKDKIPNKYVLWGILFVLLLITMHTITHFHFENGRTFYTDIPGTGTFLISYLCLFCWIAAVVCWIYMWKKECGIQMVKPSKTLIIIFLLMLIFCDNVIYNHGVPLPMGDAAANLSTSRALASGHIPYKPWVNQGYGGGRQTFYFTVYIPFCWAFGSSDELPIKTLLFSNFLSAICFFIFLRLIKINQVVALMIAAGIMVKPILILKHGHYYQQQLTPLFMFLNLIFFYKAVTARINSKDKQFIFWTVLFGVSIGMGFNVYDLNYVFGVATTFFFLCSITYLHFSMKDRKHKWQALIALLLLASMIVGIGPLLTCGVENFRYVFQSRVRSPNISAENLTDYFEHAKLFLRIHWDDKSAKLWMSKMALFLIFPGIVISFFQKPRVFWISFWCLIMLLFTLFLFSGSLGMRRVVSIQFYEYTLIALAASFLFEKFRNLNRILTIAISTVVILMLSTILVQDSLESIESGNHYEKHSLKTPYQKALKTYMNLLNKYSDWENLYVVEPTFNFMSVYWTEGRPEIYSAIGYQQFIFRKNSFEKKNLLRIMDDLNESDEPFVLIFLLADDLYSALNRVKPPQRPPIDQKIKELEKLFLATAKKLEMKRINKKTIEMGKFLKVRYYVRPIGKKRQ